MGDTCRPILPQLWRYWIIWAEKVVSALKAKSSVQMNDSQQQIASAIREFIQEHLSEGISLQTIADHIQLHPVYMSKVYKTQTGETVGEYMYRIRMERAVGLLLKTDLKIAEVSSQLVFFTVSHFIIVFVEASRSEKKLQFIAPVAAYSSIIKESMIFFISEDGMFP
ncbi:helix-turn-helix domain-containing protein [Paenibacillaceae bacterium WGS1546]|uniref:helix-turn-helix domain-containing protein n=1 Tax=Cohnella sp. WGS1546 TaxID=3366810 RepID=UPI00372D0234